MESLDIHRPIFYDVNGVPRFLKGCSVDQLDRLKSLYYEFWNQIYSIQEDLDLDFRKAIEANPKVLIISKQILKLCGIKYKWVDLPLLAALVHSYTDADGNPHRGYLAEISLYQESQISKAIVDKKDSENTVSWEEYKAQIFALMVDISGDLESAYKAYQEIPSEMIEGYSLVKQKQMEKMEKDPDNKLEKLRQKKQEFIAKMQQSENQSSSDAQKKAIGQKNLQRLQQRFG